MKEKMRKILKSLKDFLDPLVRGFLILFCVAFGMCVGLCAYEKLCRSGFFDEYFDSSTSMISANAEGSTRSKGFIEEYETVNLIPFPYEVESGYYNDNIYFNINDDGQFRFTSSGEFVSQWIILSRSLDLKADVEYTLSGAFGSLNWDYYRLVLEFFRFGESTSFFAVSAMDAPVTFTTPYSFDYVFLYFYVRENKQFNDVLIQPMLTEGSVAYPFSPCLESAKDNAYDQGVQDGTYYSSAGIFAGGSLSGTCTEVNDGIFDVDFSFSGEELSYLSGGIDLEPLGKKLEGDCSEWNQTEIIFEFNSPVPLSSFSSFRGVGVSTSFYNDLTLMDTEFRLYTFSWNDKGDDVGYSLNMDKLTAEQLSSNILITSFSTIFGGGVDGLDVSFYDKNTSYNFGYNDGYNDGVDVGEDKGYSNGYTAGLKDGETLGISIGKNSVSGDTLTSAVKGFAFSLFDAPINAFLSVFNLSYDGFNLGALVAFIFTIVVVVGVLKVVL